MNDLDLTEFARIVERMQKSVDDPSEMERLDTRFQIASSPSPKVND